MALKLRTLALTLLLLALFASPARSSGPELYPDPSQAKSDLAHALKTAAQATNASSWSLG